jgi:hypothetical protein
MSEKCIRAYEDGARGELWEMTLTAANLEAATAECSPGKLATGAFTG